MERELRKREIKAFLARKGIRQVEIAEAAGVAPSAVSAFIRGTKRHSRVKQILIEFGVPSSLLDEINRTVTVKELSICLGISECGVRKKAKKEQWFFKEGEKLRGGGFKYLYPVDMLPRDVQKAIEDD